MTTLSFIGESGCSLTGTTQINLSGTGIVTSGTGINYRSFAEANTDTHLVDGAYYDVTVTDTNGESQAAHAKWNASGATMTSITWGADSGAGAIASGATGLTVVVTGKWGVVVTSTDASITPKPWHRYEWAVSGITANRYININETNYAVNDEFEVVLTSDSPNTGTFATSYAIGVNAITGTTVRVGNEEATSDVPTWVFAEGESLRFIKRSDDLMSCPKHYDGRIPQYYSGFVALAMDELTTYNFDLSAATVDGTTLGFVIDTTNDRIYSRRNANLVAAASTREPSANVTGSGSALSRIRALTGADHWMRQYIAPTQVGNPGSQDAQIGRLPRGTAMWSDHYHVHNQTNPTAVRTFRLSLQITESL